MQAKKSVPFWEISVKAYKEKKNIDTKTSELFSFYFYARALFYMESYIKYKYLDM